MRHSKQKNGNKHIIMIIE